MTAFLGQLWAELVRWWKKLWFESKLEARLKMIELENQVESEIEREEAAKPIYTEHPIDPELQTGESQKLGGAMQLTAPWYKNDGMDARQPESSLEQDRP
jgi:hypothetical protein